MKFMSHSSTSSKRITLTFFFPRSGQIDVHCLSEEFSSELLGFLTNEVRKKTQQIRHL